jgi:hypothetical protein
VTQYVETFHRRNGVFVDGTVLPITEITSRWGTAFYAIIDGAASNDNVFDPWGLTIEDPITDGVDVRALYLTNENGSKHGIFSLTRAPDFADGSILVRCAAQRLGSFIWKAALVLRGSGAAGSETGYMAVIASGVAAGTFRVSLYKWVAGASTLLGTSSDLTITPYTSPINDEYVAYFEFKADGTDLKTRIWSSDASRPTTWDLELSDASIAAAGWAGAGCGQLTGTTPKAGTLAFISLSDDPEVDAYLPKDRDERRRFLASDEVAVALFEAGVLGTTDGGTTGLAGAAALSNTGFITKPGDSPANTAYPVRIVSIGEFSQTLNGDTLTGRGTQGFGDVVVHNANGVLDHWLRWNWAGRPFRLLLGSRLWKHCDFVLAARGTVDRLEMRAPSELVFKLRDGSNVLSRKLNRDAVGGSVTVNAEKPEPLAFGNVFNVTPVLTDDTTHKYKVHANSEAAVLAVREDGSDVTANATDLGTGEFTMSASPAGALTADVENDATTSITIFGSRVLSYPDAIEPITRSLITRHTGIFKAICYVYSDLEVDQIYISPELFSPAAAGLYISADDNPSVEEALDAIAESANGAWYWNNWGEVMARYLGLTDAYGAAGYPAGFVINLQEAHLVERSFALKRLIPPALPRKFYYKRNYTPQTYIAGSVEADRALYASAGTLVSADPGLSGLDQPSNHIGARTLDHKVTLFYEDTAGDADDDTFERENTNNAKAVGVFEFRTRAFFQEMEVMRTVDLVHSRFGFSAGQRGVVVGLRRDFRHRISTVQWATQLPGDWPDVTAAYPYVGSSEFL